MDDLIQNAADLLHSRMPSVQYLNNGQALFNNGHIAIAKDLIFGLSVWDGEAFIPVNSLDQDDLKIVKTEIARGTLPFPWPELLK